jgi:hypothetical protein
VTVPFPAELGSARWTVDEPRDLGWCAPCSLGCIDRGCVRLAGHSRAARAQPQLATINRGIARNAGYQRSLADDLRDEAEAERGPTPTAEPLP